MTNSTNRAFVRAFSKNSGLPPATRETALPREPRTATATATAAQTAAQTGSTTPAAAPPAAVSSAAVSSAAAPSAAVSSAAAPLTSAAPPLPMSKATRAVAISLEEAKLRLDAADDRSAPRLHLTDDAFGIASSIATDTVPAGDAPELESLVSMADVSAGVSMADVSMADVSMADFSVADVSPRHPTPPAPRNAAEAPTRSPQKTATHAPQAAQPQEAPPQEAPPTREGDRGAGGGNRGLKSSLQRQTPHRFPASLTSPGELAPAASPFATASAAAPALARAIEESGERGPIHHSAHLRSDPPQPFQPVSAGKAPAPVAPLTPAWEVDGFHWPRAAQHLFHHSKIGFAEAGRQLAAAAADGLHVLAVTSTFRGEGRSTVAMNLARSAARAGARVALVDADWENPRLASLLGLTAEHSWHECVETRLPADEAAVWSLADRLTLLPLTPAVRRLQSPIDSHAHREMIAKLGRQFDLVIFDQGPWRRDLQSQFASVEAAILVRDMRCTSVEQARATIAELHEAGLESVGVVQNFA